MGYSDQSLRQKPVSMAAAVAVNSSIIIAVMLSPMVAYAPIKPDRIEATIVTAKPPPPPNKPDDSVEPPKFDPVFTPKLPYTPPVKPDPMQTTDKQPDMTAGAVAGDGKSGDAGTGGEKISKKSIR